MGHHNKHIFTILIFLFLLLSLIISFACPTPPPNQPQANAPVSNSFQIKNAGEPVFLKGNKRGRRNKIGKGLYESTVRRKKAKNLAGRAFSTMLPRGYVPPSGSSPCHNLYPNSVAFFCGLSAEGHQP